jgi:hypothetical protein
MIFEFKFSFIIFHRTNKEIDKSNRKSFIKVRNYHKETLENWDE